MNTESIWRERSFYWRWLRWYIAGKILTTGTGVLAGLAFMGVLHAVWFALGTWLLSIAVRTYARSIMVEGTKSACAHCFTACSACSAKLTATAKGREL